MPADSRTTWDASPREPSKRLQGFTNFPQVGPRDEPTLQCLGTLEQLERIRRGVRGTCEIVKLPACGHAPFRDQPQAVLDALTRFVHEHGR